MSTEGGGDIDGKKTGNRARERKGQQEKRGPDLGVRVFSCKMCTPDAAFRMGCPIRTMCNTQQLHTATRH